MRLSNSRSALAALALLLLLTWAGRAEVAHAQAAPPKQNNEKSTDSPTLKPLEIDIEGLKKILRRDGEQPARPLLLNFWATWCDPCREEFPDLLKVGADYRPRGLEFVAVSFDFSEDVQKAVPDFLREVKADITPYWLNVPDPEPAIRLVDPAWTGGIPTTFLFDAKGTLLFKHTGRVKPEELRAAIDKMLDTKR